MEEHSFRVWDKEEEKYSTDWFVLSMEGELNIIVGGVVHKADPKRYIVEKCTGLRDKNGKLVYEGDVVHHTVGGLTCQIVFYRGAFCGEFVGGFTCPLSGWFRPDSDEVIGNIHEVEK